jgi:hypothetical protein
MGICFNRTETPAILVKRPRPKSFSEQAAAIRSALATFTTGPRANEVAKTFGRTTKQREGRIDEILETLDALGKAREISPGRYIAV